MPFHLDSLCGAMLMPLTAYMMDWGRNRIQSVNRKSGFILSRLWTKVHEISRKYRGPLYFPTSLPDCLRRVSFRRYSSL